MPVSPGLEGTPARSEHRRWRRRALFLVAALAVAAGVFLRRGQEDTIRAPRPAVSTDDVWVPEQPPSAIEVPVVYDLSSIVEKLEAVIPRQYGSLDERLGTGSGRGSAAFELSRGPLEARLDGTVAHVSALIQYRGRGWYNPPLLPEVSASCGTGDDDDLPRARVALSAPLSITPDWSLAARPRLDRVEPATDTDRDKCEITPLGIDVTGRVIDAARDLLMDRLPAIERELTGIDIRSRFERWWSVLSEPLRLEDDIWLVIDPREVHRGTIRGEGLNLEATVGLVAYPRIVLGPRPQPVQRPLPPLDSAAVQPGLHVYATAIGDYEVGSRRLTEALRGTEIQQAGRLLRISSIGVSGVGEGRLALEVGLEGAVRGSVFFVGRPVYDIEDTSIHVPELVLDLGSRNLLVGNLEWLAEAALVELLRERARWSVDDLVEFAEEQLRRGLNHSLGQNARLQGTVDSVSILGVYPTRGELLVHAAATAQATLIVDEEPGS